LNSAKYIFSLKFPILIMMAYHIG